MKEDLLKDKKKLEDELKKAISNLTGDGNKYEFFKQNEKKSEDAKDSKKDNDKKEKNDESNEQKDNSED